MKHKSENSNLNNDISPYDKIAFSNNPNGFYTYTNNLRSFA